MASRHVPDALLRAIQEEARPLATGAAHLRRLGLPADSCAVRVDAQDLAAIVDELLKRRTPGKATGRPISPLPRLLAEMTVGETTTHKGWVVGAFYRAKGTARKVLKNPEAQWAFNGLEDGAVKVTRLPDASPAPTKPRTQFVEALAAMQPGEVKVLETSSRGGVHACRQRARLLMGCEATWRIQTLTQGKSRVTRTA